MLFVVKGLHPTKLRGVSDSGLFIQGAEKAQHQGEETKLEFSFLPEVCGSPSAGRRSAELPRRVPSSVWLSADGLAVRRETVGLDAITSVYLPALVSSPEE